MTSPDAVAETVRSFLTEIDKLPDDFTADTLLFAEGAGLDSLETAELSVRLEDDHGTDPFSAGLMPDTLAGITAFYANPA